MTHPKFNRIMELRGGEKYTTIFLSDKKIKENRLLEINYELKKLDNEILKIEHKYSSLILEKGRLTVHLNKLKQKKGGKMFA